MKINWGTGIFLAFIGFIGFILYFVITMSVSKKYEHDLVTEDYYKQELEFQNTIDKTKNAKKLSRDISWKKTKNGLEVIFPSSIPFNTISGTIKLYRPSNKVLDITLPITLNTHTFTIPKSKILEGRWDLIVDWKQGNTSYFFKEKIVY